MTQESDFRKGVEELKKQYKEEFKLRQEILKKIKHLKTRTKIANYLKEMENMLNSISDSFAEDIIRQIKLEAETENQKVEDILKQFKEELNIEKSTKTTNKTLGEIELKEETQEQHSITTEQNTKTLGDNEI